MGAIYPNFHNCELRITNYELKIVYYNWNMKRMGPSRFRQVGERCSVIQVESESPLGNQRLKQKVNANNIVKFARREALVAA